MLEQRRFEDLGSPLSEVTFCVLDIETTGGSPATSAITEIGALKVRRGEAQGTFHTLVDPGEPVPAFIRLLTGISDEMLRGAPPVQAVLPSLIEFVAGTVLVAHNARFDVSFVNAALDRSAYPPLSNPVVDTALLARKVLAGEVPNNKLETLARHLRCSHQPCHRAYQDVLATTDVLHHLIERVAGFGVTTLEDLVAISRSRLDGTFAKIRFTDRLPRSPGVYRFVGAHGRTLYVGVASDLRTRVRSYFYGDPRRKIRNLLRETQDIVVEQFATGLEARVAEARAIDRERPPYNRVGKRRGTWYLKVAVGPKVSRIATARSVKEDGAVYVGPVSPRAARSLVDAMRDALPVHRCSEPRRCRGCAFSDMNACTGRDASDHTDQVRVAADGLIRDPSLVLDPIAVRMRRLAAQQRFEEAAETRDRGDLLEKVLENAMEVRALVEAGAIVVAVGERVILILRGRLVAGAEAGADAPERVAERLLSHVPPDDATGAGDAARRAEARTISAWLARNAGEVRIIHAERAWALPLTARPRQRFAPREP